MPSPGIQNNMKPPPYLTRARPAPHWIIVSFVAAAVTIGAALFSAPEAPATPPITWEPRALNEVVLPGGTKTVSASFTASESIGDVAVRVTPELQQYVTVSPPMIGSVAADETVELAVRLSAAPTALPELIEGTIQLRSEVSPKKNYAEPLPVEIRIEWNEFRNDYLGVEMTYPPVYTPNELTTGKVGLSEEVLSGEGGEPTPITLFLLPMSKNDAEMLIREFFEGPFSESATIVDGITATRMEGVLKDKLLGWGGHHHTYVLVPTTKGVLQIDFNSGDTIVSIFAEEILRTITLF